MRRIILRIGLKSYTLDLEECRYDGTDIPDEFDKVSLCGYVFDE